MTEQHTDEVLKRKTHAGKRPALRDVKCERQYTGWLLERLNAARGDCIHALYLVGARLDTPPANPQPFKFTEQDMRELSAELRVALTGLRTARHLVKAHMLDVAQLIEEPEAKRSGKRPRAGQDAAKNESATHREGVSGVTPCRTTRPCSTSQAATAWRRSPAASWCPREPQLATYINEPYENSGGGGGAAAVAQMSHS